MQLIAYWYHNNTLLYKRSARTNIVMAKVKIKTGKRFRAKRAEKHYDTIVVGSGMGGLANAALLSLLGKKVCVLEQHYTAGGYTHAYEREGYEWDVRGCVVQL